MSFRIEKHRDYLRKSKSHEVVYFAENRRIAELKNVISSEQDPVKRNKLVRQSVFSLASNCFISDLVSFSTKTETPLDNSLRAYAMQTLLKNGHIEEVLKFIQETLKFIEEAQDYNLVTLLFLTSAIMAFAEHRCIDQVNILLTNERNMPYREKLSLAAIMGYAIGNHVDHVNAMLVNLEEMKGIKDSRLLCALNGFARTGNINGINIIISLEKNPEKIYQLRYQAITVLTRRGDSENALLIISAEDNPDKKHKLRIRMVECMYALKNKHSTKKYDNLVLKLLIASNGGNEREQIIAAISDANSPLRVETLKKKCDKLISIMHGRNLDFDQAMTWCEVFSLPKEFHVWLLDGKQLVKNGKISEDIFVYIASFLSGSSISETKSLLDKYYRIVPQYLHENTMNRYTSSFFYKLVPSIAKNKCSEAEERLNRRLA